MMMKSPALHSVVLAGAWLGERVGNMVGAALESRAWSRAERNGALPQLEVVWGHIKHRFDALLQPHEHI
jgi:hypothetical protein